MKVQLAIVKRYIACHNRVDLCENHVSTTTVREMYQFLRRRPDSLMDCLLGCLLTLGVLIAKVVPLDHSRILERVITS